MGLGTWRLLCLQATGEEIRLQYLRLARVSPGHIAFSGGVVAQRIICGQAEGPAELRTDFTLAYLNMYNAYHLYTAPDARKVSLAFCHVAPPLRCTTCPGGIVPLNYRHYASLHDGA